MDFLEFLARSEWPALAAVILLLLRRPLLRMADGVIPKTIDLWGAKAEFEKRLSAVEALLTEQKERLADPEVRAELTQAATKLVRDVGQRLEEIQPSAGQLSEEEALDLKRLRVWKDEFPNRRTSFTYDEVFKFKEDAEQLIKRVRPS